MNSAANQDINVKVSSSKEDFWKQHAVLQKGSGLSRAEYCRKNKLNYNCLGYWLYKWKKISPKLIPVLPDNRFLSLLIKAEIQQQAAGCNTFFCISVKTNPSKFVART